MVCSRVRCDESTTVTPSAASVNVATVESTASRPTTRSWVASSASCVVGAVHLQGAPGQARGLGGGQQHAYVGVGCDDGRDVTALDHDPALRGEGALAADELLAHAEVGRHGADRCRDLAAS